MKQVLLLSYYVPPRTGIAAVRTEQLMRLLPSHGWEVTALAPERTVDFKSIVKRLAGIAPETSGHAALGVGERSVGAAHTPRQRLARVAYDVTEYANRKFGWVYHGTRSIRAILEREHFDAVLSMAPPETVHFVASSAAKAIPWVADFRDLWLRPDAHGKKSLRTSADRLLEPLTMRRCAAMTTVSEPLAGRLRARYPKIPVFAIPNAYNAADWTSVPFERTDRCTILYAGQLYGGMRDPEILFRALRALLDCGRIQERDVAVDFYTAPAPWLDALIASYRLQSVVAVRGERPRSEILLMERRASALLLLLWNHPSESGVYTGKLFEYLGARRPILAVGGPEQSVVDAVLRETGCAPRHRDAESLERALLDLVTNHAAGYDARLQESAVAPFEAVYLARRFATVLERVTARSAAEP
jgi:glycosyltransferase involved in cell wall biosynthesis